MGAIGGPVTLHGMSQECVEQVVRVVIPGHQPYEVRIGPGLLAGCGAAVRRVAPAGRALLVSDANVARHYADGLQRGLEAAGYAVVRSVVPAGESSKSLAVLGGIYDAALHGRLDRACPVVALGGGVVGDLAGFAAATLLRGLPFVQIPTSLEAAVDASVGGKTGINHAAGKNLIGAFHQPCVVVHDTEVLVSLSLRDRCAALAESVKHALLGDAGFFSWHEEMADRLVGEWGLFSGLAVELVARNVRIKAGVVEADEREGGLRAVLNLGHTVGHAVEACLMDHGAEGVWRHGEAVSVGLVAACRLAEARGEMPKGDADRVCRLLERLRLPVRIPAELSNGVLLERIGSDKKIRAGRLTFVLPGRIGTVQLVQDVGETELARAMDGIRG